MVHAHIQVDSYLLWKERVNILLGVARALFYLHPTFPHYNLKSYVEHYTIVLIQLSYISSYISHSQNVLLDCYLNAKVADFGYPIPLARQIGSTSILSTSNVSAVVNCRGYLPPEVSEGITGPETDVYGYEIVCIIIIDFPSSGPYTGGVRGSSDEPRFLAT